MTMSSMSIMMGMKIITMMKRKSS